MSRRERRAQEFTAYAAQRSVALKQTAYLLCADRHRAGDLVQIALTKLYVAWDRIERRGAVDALRGRSSCARRSTSRGARGEAGELDIPVVDGIYAALLKGDRPQLDAVTAYDASGGVVDDIEMIVPTVCFTSVETNNDGC